MNQDRPRKRITNKRTLRNWISAKPTRRRMNRRYQHDKATARSYVKGFASMARDAANNVYIDHIKMSLLKMAMRGVVMMSTNGFARIEPWLTPDKVSIRIRDLYPEDADQTIFRAKAKELAEQGDYVAVTTSNRALHSIRMATADAERTLELSVKWWRAKGLDEYETVYLRDGELPFPSSLEEFVAVTSE